MTGRELKRLRESVRVSQVDMARTMGVSAPWVCIVEGRRRPVPDAFAKRYLAVVVEAAEAAFRSIEGYRAYARGDDTTRPDVAGEN